MQESTARDKVLDWLEEERARYQDIKFADRTHDDESMRLEGMRPGAFWRDQINQYIHRAHVLGLHTPLGKQALMKAAATMLGCAESMIRVYGEPPPPGNPSGQLK